MALTKKQIKQLRSLATHLGPMVWIGKNGVNNAAVAQVQETLESHELIKCAVQESCPIGAKEVGKELADRTGAELVLVIGHRFALYKPTEKEGVRRIRFA